MDLYTVIATFNASIMFVPKRRVDWICEDNTVIQMDMPTYLFRSFLEQLLNHFVEWDELEVVLKKMDICEKDYPKWESYNVIFH